MTELPAPIRDLLARPEGARTLGPFALIMQLGRGGFAPVWLAQEAYGATTLRTVAVKLFSLGGGPQDGRAKRRAIVEEARALCQVEHPNVVRFYALPVDEALGVIGLAMEHVAGTSLDQRIAAEGRLALDDVLAVGSAIASALSAVHRAGLVHRDVKPANVVESTGGFKLIDFGIAAADAPAAEARAAAESVAPRDDLPLTAAGSRVSEVLAIDAAGASTARFRIPCGTVGYVDPECMGRGKEAAPSSDLYALGAMLFECVTGRLPAALPGGQGLRSDVLYGDARPPRLLDAAKSAPPELGALVDALLAPERADRPSSAEAVAQAIEQLRWTLAGRGRALPPEEIGPFRGLGRFEAEDRAVYFGRVAEIAACVEATRSRPLITLVGPSGSGKSSLARAGVLPAIVGGALGPKPARWETAIASPGRDPRAAILAALAPLLGDVDRDAPARVTDALAARAERGVGTILLLDQLEELATLAEPESLAWCVELLTSIAARGAPGLRVVCAARRDLVDAIFALPGLGRALARGLVLVEPLGDLVWGEILDQALGAYGYAFEDDALRAEVLADLRGSADAMPLVQFALTELWKRRDRARLRITREGMRAVGGIRGALERHADTALRDLERDDPAAAEAARRMLLALTTPKGTRAARSLEETLAAAGDEHAGVLEALERARIVVRSDAGVTLAHEALLTHWERLRGWVAEAREDRLFVEELERDGERWRADPEAAPLWRRRRLTFAEELRRRQTIPISRHAQAFLDASRRAERRALLAVAGAVAIAGIAGAAGIGSYLRAVRAEQHKTLEALAKEQSARRDADQRAREVQEAQGRIDELLRRIEGSPTKDEVLALQQRIREAGAQGARSAGAPAPARAVAPPAKTEAPAAEAPAPAPASATIKMRKSWD